MKRIRTSACICVCILLSLLLVPVVPATALEEGEVWDKSVSESFAGSGTQDDPYLIRTGADLALLSASVVPQDGKATDCFEGVYFKMTADIDMGNYTMDMIGAHGVESTEVTNSTVDTVALAWFCGVFDGDGHVIRNLKINNPTNAYYVGLFSTLKGTVKNLGIESGKIQGKEYVGSVVGMLHKKALVENCWNAAEVYSGRYCAGGIAGWTYGTIRNCSNLGVVTCWGTDRANCGGLIGYAKTGTTVENGFASATLDPEMDMTYVGGLIGKADKDGTYSKTTVSNSYFEQAQGGPTGIVCSGYADNTNYKSDFGYTDYAVTGQQIASGEVTYRLGAAFGQDLTAAGSYPVPGSPALVAKNEKTFVNTDAAHLLSNGNERYSAFVQQTYDNRNLRVIFVADESLVLTSELSMTVTVRDGDTVLASTTVTGEKLEAFVAVEAAGEYYYAANGKCLFGMLIVNIPEGILESGILVDVSFDGFTGSATL